MGTVGISWTDILSWSQLTGSSVDGWEAETLFLMSAAYADMFEQGKDPACPPPWEPPTVEARRKEVSNLLAAMFDGMMKNRG